MTKPADASDALRKAAAIIQKLEQRIEYSERSRSEPIAIVGVGCRLPGGVVDLESYWRLMSEGRDVVGPIPSDRFDIESIYNSDPSVPGTSYVREGAFLERVDLFDAEFFGISPREAAWIDPQHRLLVECAFEALEDAGIPVEQVKGSRAGVYVGLGVSDYAQRFGSSPLEALEGYLATGTGSSFSAGRISFLLGLQGPSVMVDTACSASLTALHLACNALRVGDCSLALAGGVQLMISPQPFVLLSRLRALSPDGRCKTFSNRANGYGRGEGCGVLVLKRLSDAVRDKDRILSLIRGTSVNQDGASSGMTAPNGKAQREVILQALQAARSTAAEVDYVEAHGTGTALGDPIELEALAEVYGPGRAAALDIGSVKTNIGHLEAAAGVAGVLKIIAALRNGALPASLHAEQLNEFVDWPTLPLEVVRRHKLWPATPARRRRAGVSSFGMSGTNAHAILEEAPEQEPARSAPARQAELIVLSAKTREAVDAVAGRLRAHLRAHPEIGLGDLAYSLVTTRSLLAHRLAVAAASVEDLTLALKTAEQGETPAEGVRAQAREQAGSLAWMFTGQGSQRVGMGRQLYAAHVAFRAALDAACAAIDPLLERPMREVMWAEGGTADAVLLDQTAFTQPALFAFEWALAQLWRSWGVQPDVVLGHSIGEITAACVAGVFSLEDAARLVCARGRLMQALPSGGAMVSIAASEADVAGLVAAHAQTVSVAAVNAPSSIVVAGVEADVLAIAEHFMVRGARVKRLSVSHAFHSPLMDPMLEAFRSIARSIRYQPATLPLISNSSGALAGDEVGTPEYWVRHVRSAVRFSDGAKAAYAVGARTFVEIGPRATLLGLLPESVPEEADLVLLSSQGDTSSEPAALAKALGGWVARGGSVNWQGLYPSGGRRVPLPTYPWQRQRHWVDVAPGAERERGGRWLLSSPRRELPNGSSSQILSLGTRHQPYLRDHIVHGVIVVPGAFYLSVLLAAAADRWPGASVDLADVEFLTALTLDEDQSLELHLTTEGDAGELVAEFATRRAGTSEWITHARARISVAEQPLEASFDLPALLEETRAVEPDAILDKLAAAQVQWGPAWYLVSGARAGATVGMVELSTPPVEGLAVAPLHPVVIDNGFAAFLLGATATASDGVPRLPFAIGRLRYFRPATQAVRCAARPRDGEPSLDADMLTLDLAFWDESGALVAQIDRFSLRRAPRDLLLRRQHDTSDELYRIEWKVSPSAAGAIPSKRRVLVVGDPTSELTAAVCAALESAGAWPERAERARLTTLRSAVSEDSAFDDVLCVWESNDDAPEVRTLALANEGLAVVQAFAAWAQPPRLWWLTRGAVAVQATEDVKPELAALWGLGRTVMLEHPELRCSLVDLESSASALSALAEELMAGGDENQVAWREGQRHVARLVRAPAKAALPTAENHRLTTRHKGALDSLVLVEAPRLAPAPGELEIETRANGINFRDVLNALGMYPGEAGPLGGECAGVVAATGAGVTRFAVGDRVMTALAPGGFRRYVSVDARLVCPIPNGVSFERAATIPAAFLTAWYALHDLARLAPHERVLIHAAAGGVGMAAVQIAQWIGAKVLGTASAAKQDVVRGLGVNEVASSRDLTFVEAFRRAEGGVDVVLNSLAGEFIDASLSLLSSGGRFIEMGKLDIRDSAWLERSHPGVMYRAFDLALVDPDRIAQMLLAIVQGFESGHLRPLPLRVFDVTEAESAFRYMAQARHVGKVVLRASRSSIAPAGTVLISGGLGALGLEVARYFAERGVQHLLLIGRRGLDVPGVASALEALRASGTRVTVAALDIADREALRRALTEIPSEYPLRGVVHAAGLVDDGLLREQTPERFSRVMAPKVAGARNLDELTRDIALDFFVSFSSLAATLGSAAQGGYAAANAFLDGLAQHSRACGLPALSLGWGPWADGGMAAGLDDKLKARFERQGIGMLGARQGIALLESCLGRPEAQLSVVPLDLRVVARSVGTPFPPIWRSLLRPAPLRTASARGSWRVELWALPVDQRLQTVSDVIRSEVARVLSLASADRVPLDQPFQELGLDSLMAVELRNVLERRMGQKLPATVIFHHPTANSMARYLLDQLSGPLGSAASSARSAAAYCECLKPLVAPRARLFGFHDAGGSASLFEPFCRLESDDVEVHAVSNARSRIAEGTGELYLEAAVGYIRSKSDLPYVLFGHSLGGLFAWRVLKALGRQGVRLPHLLVLSAAVVPSAIERAKSAEGLTELFNTVVGDRLRAAKSLRADFDADFALWAALPAAGPEPVDVDIQAFVGQGDAYANQEAMTAWSQATTTAFSLSAFPGGHFYITEDSGRSAMLRALREKIRDLLNPAAAARRDE
jgi:acyl transferase domain-containing protein/surfactin synthase thioesterase subunit